MLARARGLEVREAPYSLDQWRSDAASGRLREVFACGTAAVLTAIGAVKTPSGRFKVANGEEGPLTRALRAQLTDIQRGRAADPHQWVHRLGASDDPQAGL